MRNHGEDLPSLALTPSFGGWLRGHGAALLVRVEGEEKPLRRRWGYARLLLDQAHPFLARARLQRPARRGVEVFEQEGTVHVVARGEWPGHVPVFRAVREDEAGAPRRFLPLRDLPAAAVRVQLRDVEQDRILAPADGGVARREPAVG